MEYLTKSNLIDCLSLLATTNFRKIEITDLMVEMYFRQLSQLDRHDFDRAIDHFYNQKTFPSPQEILEFLGEVEPIDSDWYKIVGVARQSTKQETISGISLAALLKVTSANGMRSALIQLSRADDNQINRYRTDWQRECKKADKSGLPPAEETITLEVSAAQDDREYPVDHDYSIRTASLIKLLRNREIKPSTATAMSRNFPAAKKQEVLDVVEEIECATQTPPAPVRPALRVVPEDFAA